MPEDQELTDANWRTLCNPAGLDCDVRHAARRMRNSSETARVVGDARRRREKVLEKIERRLQR